MHRQNLKLLLSKVYEEMHLQENTLFDLDLGVKVTRNVTQYPLHHVIYASTKFEVATSNGLGEDTITRNVTDGRTDRQTDARTDRLWYEINIPYFSNEKAGIIRSLCHNSYLQSFANRLYQVLDNNDLIQTSIIE